MVKKFRYRKVTPMMKSRMVELREQGMTYFKIASIFNVTLSTTQYHLSENERQNSISRAVKANSKITKEERVKINKKRYPYQKEYYMDRYRNDPEFRRRQINCIMKSFARRREKWIEKELCSRCGSEKINKDFRQCEICREKKRK